ncbi:MarR family winged helix-turn-helix transcriptional regulator [Pseudonocardia sp. MH-G8]|uniref:MarR family winged helix-turn-helix transcriptional regulator n=1 Tax=Pseudonocardia sp. MH-G8 TaxID=1854588 RepID=UPI000BA09EBC|nr:MarR family transcriptional regulator [Pseudonocardia sp. MH-G8]OZM81987.1 MarR family transcriptional regulator [Pseudonocardia sp. MH-G8]
MEAVDARAEEFLALMRAVGALHRSLHDVGDAVAASANQSRARSTCLQQIAGGPRTVADIGERLGLARQGVQRVADLLVADGLATYTDNPRHRRAKLLMLTAAGERALATMDAAHRRWVADTAPELVPLRLPELTDHLDAVRHAVDAARRPDSRSAERS